MAPQEEHLAAGSTFNVVKFIKLMKEYPFPPARKSKVHVDATWKQLEREMKVPRNILERKRHNLIGTYRRELRLALTAGQGFVSKWPHFQAMDFMRNDILSRMKINHTRQCGRAAGIRNEKIIDKRYFGEVNAPNPQEISEHQERPQPYHELNMCNLDENHFPIANFSLSPAERTSRHVYDFLMMRIHPYVAAMPIANQMAVLGQMQQLVFEEYTRRVTPFFRRLP